MAEPKLLATIARQHVTATGLNLEVNYDVAIGPSVRQTVLIHQMVLPATATESDIEDAIAEYGESEVWPRYVDAAARDENAAAKALAGRDLDVKAIKARGRGR